MNAIPTAAEPSKPAHTPGPWQADGFADCQLITKDVPVALGRPIGIGKIYGGNMIADARLIAAAPDMFKALVDLVNSFEKHRPKEYWDAARAAIAKATGGAA